MHTICQIYEKGAWLTQKHKLQDRKARKKTWILELVRHN